MWILKPLEDAGETHYLLPNKEYVVGRKNCDILLSNDQSISRAHAHLTATAQTLTLKDSSKYGSFVNNQRLSENDSHILTSGDSVTFGVFHSKFCVDHQKIVVCTSCVDNDGKASLSQALLPLGGKLVNSWTQDCTHLIMPSVKVTIKTICALLCCRPIVKPEFFTELTRALQQKTHPPNPDGFIPEIDEPSLNIEKVELGAKPERRRIFDGKTFIFLSSKQFKRLSAAVSFGGGRSQLLQEPSMPQSLLESQQSCVVDIAFGNTHVLLPSATNEWANSVKSILQIKGLRLIPESEIGLAAIYSSCDKYCNPSNPLMDSMSTQKVQPSIIVATLSQNAAVEETVLSVASQNITAYAVNTEPFQGTEHSKVAGVSIVMETPERSHNRSGAQPCQSKPIAQETEDHCTAVSPSFNVENTESQRKKAVPKPQVSHRRNDEQPCFPKANGGTRLLPQKQMSPTQGSPQKQSTLINFFQPVNKKRLREEESSAAQSQPKRAVPPPPSPVPSSTPSSRHSAAASHADTLPTASGTHSQPGSRADLFAGPSEALPDTVFPERKEIVAEADISVEELESVMSENMECYDETTPGSQLSSGALSHRVSHPALQGPQSRKRKEVEAEAGITMEELESIMSQDMDCLDEPPTASKKLQAQQETTCSTNGKSPFNTAASKRQRIDPPSKDEANQKLNVGLENASTANSNQRQQSAETTSAREKLAPERDRATNQWSSKHSATRLTTNQCSEVKDDEVSFVLKSAPVDRDLDRQREVLEAPQKPTVKQEAPKKDHGEDLPKRLVLVEFKSLTVTGPPKAKPKQIQGNGYTKNFKCFRKVPVPAADDLPQVIRGLALLAHHRGNNSELDEWLKDAAEEEHRNKCEESLGDDLFRYNPSKLTRRR